MGSEEIFLVREYRPEVDREMVEGWYGERGRSAPPAGILPRLGVVSYHEASGRDCAALWLYMDNSVGVCFPEHVVTRPGMGLAMAKGALLRALDYVRVAAADLGYGVMWLNTLPAMARVLKKAGAGVEIGRGKVTMIGATKENLWEVARSI